jgi:hypothetical protein
MFAAVSPGSNVKFVAKSITRVRSSWPNSIGAVVGNGSAVNVVDSTAIARVEFVFVSRTGVLASRALVGASSARPKKMKTRMKQRRLAGELPIVRP